MLFLEISHEIFPFLIAAACLIIPVVLLLLVVFVKQLIKRIKKLNNSNNKSSNVQYLDFFGGSENIVSVTKNLTRVTVEVVDLEKVNLEKLRELGIGVFITGNVIKCSSAEFAEQIK